MKVTDIPTTDIVNESIGRFIRSMKDHGDLTEALFDQCEGIFANAFAGDECEVGRIVTQAIKQYVADLASREVFGREGVIKLDEVHL